MSKKSSNSTTGAAAAAPITDDHPTLQLDRDTQAKLLSEALLREFMHKRKFLQTLKQFDIENPRTDSTITSRALMQEMMVMQKVMPQMKSTHGIESIVEAVCQHRIEKKHHLHHVKEMQLEIGSFTEMILQLKRELEGLKQSNAKKEKELEYLAAAKNQSSQSQSTTSNNSNNNNTAKLDTMRKETISAEQQTRNISLETTRIRAEIAQLEKELKQQQQEADATTKDKKKKNKDKKDKKKATDKDDGGKEKKSSKDDKKKASDKKKEVMITSIDQLLEENEEHLAIAAKNAEALQQQRRRSSVQDDQQDDQKPQLQASEISSTATTTAAQRNQPPTRPPTTASSTSTTDNKKKKQHSKRNENDDDLSVQSTSEDDDDDDDNEDDEYESDNNKNNSSSSDDDDDDDSVPFKRHPPSSSGSTAKQNNQTQNRKQQQQKRFNDSEGDEDDYQAGLRAIREEANRENKLSRKNSLSGDGSLPRRRSWNQNAAAAVAQQHHQGGGGDGGDSSTNSSVSPGNSRSENQQQQQAQPMNNNNNYNNSNFDSNGNLGESASNLDNSESNLGNDNDDDDHVGANLATNLILLLVGKHKRIPNSFFQPIIFTRVSNHPYGLVQKMGGPCGAIAALQARIIAHWFFAGGGGGGGAGESRKHQRPVSALNAALTAIFKDILAVRQEPDEPAVFVVPPTSARDAHDTLQKQVHALSHCVLLEERTTAYPAELLTEAWTTSHWGLVCFILSCVLTRARRNNDRNASPAEVIYSHMDEPRSLIVEHGYCSQEMLNLMLCGWATSHVHDGVHHVGGGGGGGGGESNNNNNNSSIGGIALRGLYPVHPGKPLDVGFISMMEVRKLLTVGSLGKNPKYPVWIVYNESHFTVLYGKDDKSYDSLTTAASTTNQQQQQMFDLYYYDQQCEEEEYRITVTPSLLPLPAARANALVSFVDQILRTRSGWEYARVNWNGADPLL